MYPLSNHDRSGWTQWHWELRELLNSEWDPLGVADPSGVDDEYDSYVNGIVVLMKSPEKKLQSELIAYLTYVEAEWMGLGPSDSRPGRLQGVVMKVVALGAPP